MLRKAAAETLDVGRFSADQFHDVLLTMKASKSSDTASKIITGDIHALSAEPFCVHVYKEHMLKKYRKKQTTLHLDATGSVVRNIGGKPVYCYALIAEDPVKSYPLAVICCRMPTRRQRVRIS